MDASGSNGGCASPKGHAVTVTGGRESEETIAFLRFHREMGSVSSTENIEEECGESEARLALF